MGKTLLPQDSKKAKKTTVAAKPVPLAKAPVSQTLTKATVTVKNAAVKKYTTHTLTQSSAALSNIKETVLDKVKVVPRLKQIKEDEPKKIRTRQNSEPAKSNDSSLYISASEDVCDESVNKPSTSDVRKYYSIQNTYL